MTPLLAGRVRHRHRRRSGATDDWKPWAANLVCFGALDLIGGLLVSRPGLRGIGYLAVGTGDPAWDADAPTPIRSRTRLVNEVLRVPLAPGQNLIWDAASSAVGIRITLSGAAVAPHVLREVGLFGGRASARPGSGLLLNHKAHEPIELAAGDLLDREIRLEIPTGLLPGARELIGGLLARREGAHGLSYVAFGTDGSVPAEPPQALLAEVVRVPMDEREDCATTRPDTWLRPR